MRRRIFYPAVLIFIGIVIFAVLLQFPNFLFPEGESSLWNHFRIAYFSVFTSVLICGIIIIVREKSMIFPYFAKLYKFRSLIYQLVKRDFKAKYKRSVLGILWTILNPLLTMFVLVIVFSKIFRFEIENFPVYLLSGTLLFGYFSESTNMAMGSILAASAMLKKVNIPKYIFPITKVLSSLVTLAFSFAALVIVMIVTKCPVSITIILIPVPIIYLFIFSMGIGMILASIIVFFRDINYLYGVFLTALTYLSALFYPISAVPGVTRTIISMNPVYHFIRYFRNLVLYGVFPSIWDNLVCISISFIALFIGLFIFYRNQDRFILYI